MRIEHKLALGNLLKGRLNEAIICMTYWLEVRAALANKHTESYLTLDYLVELEHFSK